MLPFVQTVYVFIMNVFMTLVGSARPRWSFLALLLAGGITFSLSGMVITGVQQKSMCLSARPH